MKRTAVVGCITCSLVAMSWLAEAASRERVAIVPLSANGKGAAKVAALASRTLGRGLRRGRGVQLVSLGYRRASKLRVCLQQPECVRALSERVRAAYLITGHLERQGGAFHLDLRLVSGASGEVVSNEALELGARSPGLALRAALQLLASARRSGLKAPAALVRASDAASEAKGTFSRADAELGAAVLEERDKEDPLHAPASAPASQAVTKAVPRPVRSLPPAPITSRSYWPAWTTAGAGLAALGVGAAFGIVSAKSVKDARDTASQREAFVLRDKAEKNALVANILYGVGGAALVTSAVLFIVEHRNQRSGEEVSPRLQLGVEVAAGNAGVWAKGSF